MRAEALPGMYDTKAVDSLMCVAELFNDIRLDTSVECGIRDEESMLC